MADALTGVVATAREAGSAVRIDFRAAADTRKVRVVRRVGTDPTSPSDAAAAVVFDGLPPQFSGEGAGKRGWVIDHGYVPDPAFPGSPMPLLPLVNGADYRYAVYSHDGTDYSDAVIVRATPAFQAGHDKVDAKGAVRQRLETTLAALLASGDYTFKTKVTAIPVIGMYAKGVSVPFPLVSVVRVSDANAERFLGDHVGKRVGEAGHETLQARGNRVSFKIIGWSQDPDERDRLYEIVEAALSINFGVLSEMGFEDPSLSGSDDQTFDDSPLYFAVFTLTGTTRSTVQRRTDVLLTAATPDGTLEYQSFDGGRPR